MPAFLTFHPLGNADCTVIELADGRTIVVDFANTRNPDDPADKRVDLPAVLRNDLRRRGRDYHNAVLFTHLDADHTKGAADFFWLEHAAKYQGPGRVKMKELWVPACAVIEEGVQDDAWAIRQEARHRLKAGQGIRVFSRPELLRSWLEKNGLTLESRAHLIVDAGKTVPGFSLTGPERAEFFIHSPFAWRQNESEVIDRNGDSVVFQAAFLEDNRTSYALFASDIDHETIAQIVKITRSHGRDERLLWDLFKIPHHCSYLSIGPDKGTDETKPVPEVKWLCEKQGRQGALIVSTSKPIPVKGSEEDKDPQPPHRQAANYYARVLGNIDGEFVVTMSWPSAKKPQVMTVRIDGRGVTLLSPPSAAAPAAAIAATPVRAGKK